MFLWLKQFEKPIVHNMNMHFWEAHWWEQSWERVVLWLFLSTNQKICLTLCLFCKLHVLYLKHPNSDFKKSSMSSADSICSHFKEMMIDGKMDATDTSGLNLWLITEAGNGTVCVLPFKQNTLHCKHDPRGNASFRRNNNVPWRLFLMHACWL